MNIKSEIKPLCWVLVLFLLVPVCALLIGWQWQETTLNPLSSILFYFTETSGLPWAVLSCVIFSLIFVVSLKIKNFMQMVKIVALFVFALGVGQAVKSTIKSVTADPRPYVMWIEKNYHIDSTEFYAHSRAERQKLVENVLANSNVIPLWLNQHWQNETGYTFPSGHTLFATTWAFLALLLIGFKRNKFVTTAFIVWAFIVGVSRLALGMHFPVDLIVATILSSMIAVLCYWLAIKFRIINIGSV